jgi:hypothetical protein
VILDFHVSLRFVERDATQGAHGRFDYFAQARDVTCSCASDEKIHVRLPF